jgi:hypothetical protein
MITLAYSNTSSKTIEGIIHQKELRGTEYKESLKMACSYASWVSKGYPMTYYPSGLLFTTEATPVKCIPFDEWKLRCGKYLAGFESFMFNSIEEMVQRFPSSKAAQRAAMNWRWLYELILNGRHDSWMATFPKQTRKKLLQTAVMVYGSMEQAKEQIMAWKAEHKIQECYQRIPNQSRIKPSYNEILFQGKIRIEPVAVFGFKEPICGLPRAKTALEHNNRRYPSTTFFIKSTPTPNQ